MNLKRKVTSSDENNQFHRDNNPGLSELNVMIKYLSNQEATASLVSEVTETRQQDVFRYLRKLQKSNRIWELKLKP